jgi:predicted phosphodiesterase
VNTDRIDATTPDEALDATLAGTRATILACGHTHQPLVRRHRALLLINPGSVGLPYQPSAASETAYRPPWAEYAIVSAGSGSVAVELRRTPVGIAGLREQARRSGILDVERWASAWQG